MRANLAQASRTLTLTTCRTSASVKQFAASNGATGAAEVFGARTCGRALACLVPATTVANAAVYTYDAPVLVRADGYPDESGAAAGALSPVRPRAYFKTIAVSLASRPRR